MNQFLSLIPTITAWAVLIAALAVAAVAAIRLGYQKQVAETAFNFVVQAELQIRGTKRGQERKAIVTQWLKAKIPFPFSLFITDEIVDKVIEKAFQQMKSCLETAIAAQKTGEEADDG
jgi:hypothetical protein